MLDPQARRQIQVQEYMDVVCGSLLIYDCACTFVPEVSLIWNAPWNLTKVLYISTKYLPFITFAVILYDHESNMTKLECLVSEGYVAWMVNASICIAEVIFTIRTWAVWGRTREMGMLLFALSMATWVVSSLFIGIWFKAVTRPIPGVQVNPSVCYHTGATIFIPASYIVLLSFQTVNLFLMSIKAYQSLKGSVSTNFSRVVYLDGILYYVYLFCFSVVNIVLDLTLSTGYENLLSKLQGVICSILACRMVLHLRECAKRISRLEEASSVITPLDVMVFRRTYLTQQESEMIELQVMEPTLT